jgi:signal peptidase I
MKGLPSAGATDAIALATKALASFGRLDLRVGGTSMLPAIRPGDVVAFQALDAEDVSNPGDIVLFRRGGSLVAHRVVARTRAGLLTQGDSLGAPDPEVAHVDVIGRGVGLKRNGRVLPWSVSRRPAFPLRWWFRRFDLATRMWLRWHRTMSRIAA